MESVRKAFKEAIEKYGCVDILVNNAGISENTSFMDYTEETFDKVMDLNVKGVFNTTRVAAECMVARGKGVILSTSSMVSISGQPSGFAYPASKFAVNGLTVSLARELQDDCDTIGEGQNLGELKSYVLLQVLNLKFGEQIYVFCSDDKNARNGVISIGGARCISVLSSFVRLKKEISFTKEDAMPYIDSYMNTCLGKDQTAFRVQDTSKERRMCRIPCEQVFEEIFDGKIDELITGNLKYI